MSTETRVRATMAGFATLAALLALLVGRRRRLRRRLRHGDAADRRRRGRRPADGDDRALPAADRRFDLDVPRRRSGRRLRQAELGRGVRGHGRRRSPARWASRCARRSRRPIQLTWYEQTRDRRPAPSRSAAPTTPAAMLSDEWYSPYLLRVDEAPEHLQAGATWTIDYTKTKTTSSKPTATTNQTESWKVDGVDVVTAVPAGTFNALKVTRTDTADGSDQDAVVRARRRQGPRAHRRRPLRRADHLHHRPVASPIPSPRAAGRGLGRGVWRGSERYWFSISRFMKIAPSVTIFSPGVRPPRTRMRPSISGPTSTRRMRKTLPSVATMTKVLSPSVSTALDAIDDDLAAAVVADVDLREHLGLQPVVLVRDDAADLDGARGRDRRRRRCARPGPRTSRPGRPAPGSSPCRPPRPGPDPARRRRPAPTPMSRLEIVSSGVA